MFISQLVCTECSCLQEFEGTTLDGLDIYIYHRSGVLRVYLNKIVIFEEIFMSYRNENFFASLDEIQGRLVSEGIIFPEGCSLYNLSCTEN